jgi:cobalamin biosynthesis Mg chelatase CobN
MTKIALLLASLLVVAGLAVAQTTSGSDQSSGGAGNTATSQSGTTSTSNQNSTTGGTSAADQNAQGSTANSAGDQGTSANDQSAAGSRAGRRSGRLPATASPLPLLSLLGFASLGTGLFVRPKR